MSHMVRLLPMDISFVVREGETVLDAALNNNIAFPNRCQMGSCAMCHVHVPKSLWRDSLSTRATIN